MTAPGSMPYRRRLGAVTVTVYRQTQDRFGNLTVGASHTIPNCSIAQSLGQGTRASTETDGNLANTITTGQVLYAPYDADILATDVIAEPDGTRYQVQGDPARWRSPFTGYQAGCQVTLERVRG